MVLLLCKQLPCILQTMIFILHFGVWRGGEGMVSPSCCPQPLPILNPTHDVFIAPLLSASCAHSCSLASPLLTPAQSRKDYCHHEGKTLRTLCIFAGLQLLHTVDLEAVDGIPIVHRPVDGNGGAGSWVWFLRYDSWCLWDWEENLQLLFTLLYFQPNYLQVHEATWSLIFTEQTQQALEIWTILVQF